MNWPLVWTIAFGYLGGRVLAHIGGIFTLSVFNVWFRRSPRWQALLRKDLQRDRELKRRLESPL